MNLYPNQLFHIYNRGNNKQRIFFKRENYLYFLKKVKEYLKPHADIIAWCLMPNHFHFLIYIRPEKDTKEVSTAIQIILRSYTRGINKQEIRTGSLFTQNTCSKPLAEELRINYYATTCFHYIHQNPMNSRLVQRMEDWEFSSFRDYIGIRNGTLISREVTKRYIEVSDDYERFYAESYKVISDNLVEKLF